MQERAAQALAAMNALTTHMYGNSSQATNNSSSVSISSSTANTANSIGESGYADAVRRVFSRPFVVDAICDCYAEDHGLFVVRVTLPNTWHLCVLGRKKGPAVLK